MLWLSIGWMSSPLTFPLWIALMFGSAALCTLGALFRSRWFLVPAVGAALLTVLIFVSAISE